MSKYVVADADEIPDGHRRVVSVAGRSIGLFNVGGRFFAVRNRCAHQGGPLCEGHLVGHLSSDAVGSYELDESQRLIECPWHGWEFDLESGQSWFDPQATRVRSYEVSLAPGADLEIDPATGLAAGPYKVETFPVRVEGRYLVLEL